MRANSIKALRGEIERALALSAEYLVLHPGSWKGLTREEGLRLAVESVARALDGFPGRRRHFTLLIENTAGAEFSLGGFSAAGRRAHRPPKARGSGRSLPRHLPHPRRRLRHRQRQGYEATVRQIEQLLGFETVRVWHMNDAKAARGSHLDRHEHIGEGTIGIAPFRRLLNDPRFAHAAFIAETPVDQPDDDLRNVSVLRSLIARSSRRGQLQSLMKMPPTDAKKNPGARSETVAISPPAAAAHEVRYDPAEIEVRWQQRWDEQPDLYRAEPENSGRPKYYVLEMLPYPSGQLHMGHVRNYAIGDALARYMWMQGYNVLHPMGWDAFGLPAENAALKNDTPPREWTLKNIAHMRRQMRRLGLSYDWQTEITTCLPDYYRWTQWFFLRMLEKGLAFRKQSKVNWCPLCATVLANEQVIDGCCWRHEDTVVEQRDLEQWFLRTTNYAQELLDGLDQLPGWPEKVRTMQRNWIGRSEGATIEFVLDPAAAERENRNGKETLAAAEGFVAGAASRQDATRIPVYTTRLDTIFGATSLQLAPQHPLVKQFAQADERLAAEVATLVEEQKKAREAGDPAAIEKHGVFTGHYAINPFNGERVPIWVANYILLEYGAGAVMSVPAHDERDFEFASKYGLEVRIVVLPRRTRRAARRRPARRAGVALHRRRQPAHELRRLQRAGLPGGAGKDGGLRPGTWLWPAHRHLPAEGLGRQPPALLGRAHPRALLPQRRHRARAR